ncbi:NAD(P)-dependent oxidoreductase [Plantactinospora sp. BB1]|uniref:NAD-dependent epimerase/dehydratase family protein n=1 Tax=Plantactinospora sp. BB1 TaxID=2071627 RepID=UPI000D15A9D3|nr:NAD-dependent epimerase/dehydratase family protein [Plantactinospora sp. BB1]AVT35949.1 epimerase [Plantactinospora sp. BB1]
MSRALVLGGAGFIGLHLTRRLVAEGHEVTCVDDFSRGRWDDELAEVVSSAGVEVVSADLTRPSAWAALPHGYDQIYLLAAVVGVRNVAADPSRVVRVNTLTALHLLDWLTPGDRVFFSSTSEVYAGGVTASVVPVPTDERVPVLVPNVAAPRFAYGISKLLGEAALLHGAAAKGCHLVIGRFHNVYGPRMGADHVIPEMVLRALGAENPFRVWGADQSRAFCHVDDAVEAVLRLMRLPEAPGVVNIGNDTEETNIADLAKLVLRVARVDTALAALPAPADSVARRCPDLGLLRRLTGFEPEVPLEEGVRRTFEWYRDHVGASAGPAEPGPRR